MVALIIIAVLAVLLVTLSMLKIKLRLVIDKGATLTVFCLFIKHKFDLSGKEDKKSDKKDKSGKKSKNNKNTKSSKKNENGYIKNLYKKNNPVDATEKLLALVKELLVRIKELLIRFEVEYLKLNIVICGEEPASTAIAYGTVCAFAYPLLSAAVNTIDIKKKDVNISADYSSQNSAFAFEIVLKAQIWRVIRWFISLIKDFSKLK